MIYHRPKAEMPPIGFLLRIFYSFRIKTRIAGVK